VPTVHGKVSYNVTMAFFFWF